MRPVLHIQIPREIFSTDAMQVALAVRLELLDRKFPTVVARELAQLLEEEGHAAALAVRLEGTSPAEVERARLLPGFSANDYRVDSTQVDIPDILKQRFTAEEAYAGRSLAQVVDARIPVLAVVHSDAKPDVLVSIPPIRREEALEVLRPLGQQLPSEVSRTTNQRPEVFSCHTRSKIVEDVAEIAAKDQTAGSAFALESLCGFTVPSKRNSPVGLRVNLPRSVWPPGAAIPPVMTIHRFRIAVLAARADVSAAEPWVED